MEQQDFVPGKIIKNEIFIGYEHICLFQGFEFGVCYVQNGPSGRPESAV